MAGDIEKEAVFVSPHLEKITVSDDRSRATLKIRDAAKSDEVVDKASRFIAVMAKQLTGFEIKMFHENVRKDEGPYQPGVNAELVSRGWVHDYGEGQVAYSGPVLRLAQLLNAKAVELYAGAFNIVDSHFPSFVSAETLHKCGYFDSHPNQASFVGTVVEDFDAIEEFRRANSCSEGAVLPPQEHMHHGGMCLNPAACFPAYPTFEGKTIGEEGLVVSWQGRVFRYESRNITGLDRLYEFNVRELVWIGTEEYVAECRRKAIPAVGALAAFFRSRHEAADGDGPVLRNRLGGEEVFPGLSGGEERDPHPGSQVRRLRQRDGVRFGEPARRVLRRALRHHGGERRACAYRLHRPRGRALGSRGLHATRVRPGSLARAGARSDLRLILTFTLDTLSIR